MNKILFSVMATCILSGCGSMHIETPQNLKVINCVDYCDWNYRGGDTVIHGDIVGSKDNESHLWLKRDGVCFDNQHQTGFDCDDPRYEVWKEYSKNGRDVINTALLFRPRGVK